MSYNALIWGIMSAGCIPFPISTRNSTAAVSHLLGKSSVQVLFTSRDTAIQGLVNSALASEDFENIVRLNTPTFEDLYVQESSGQGEYSPPPPPTSKEYDQTALILHSSGKFYFLLDACCLICSCTHRKHCISQSSKTISQNTFTVDNCSR